MEKNIQANFPGSGRLFFKTYVSFAAVITVFAISLGVFYMRMYDRTLIGSNTEDLQQKAANLAQKCSTCFTSNDFEAWFDYYQYLVGVDGLDTMTVSNAGAKRPLTDAYTGQTGPMETNGDKVQEMTRETIEKKAPVSGTGYSSAHDCKKIIVSAPVM